MFKAIAYILVLVLIGFVHPNAVAVSVKFETYEVTVKAGEAFEGVRYPPGSRVHLTKEGHVVANVVLSEDFAMNGHIILKGSTLYVTSGKLRGYFAEQGQMLQGIQLHKGTQVSFSEDGVLDSMHLSKPTRIGAQTYAANSWVQFHPTGIVAEGTVGKADDLNGLRLRVDGDISFHVSGSVACVPLREVSKHRAYHLAPRYMSGEPCDASFWPNGQLQEGLLARAVRIEGITCGVGTISFAESGRLEHCARVDSRN